MDKDKKKTLTISSDLKKKIDTTSLSTSGKKSFFVEKKKPFKPNKSFNKPTPGPNSDVKKKNFARKFIEQQATKDFIKKDNKPAGKSKLKLNKYFTSSRYSQVARSARFDQPTRSRLANKKWRRHRGERDVSAIAVDQI